MFITDPKIDMNNRFYTFTYRDGRTTFVLRV